MAQIFLVIFIICVIGIIVTLVWIFIEPPTCSKVRDLKIGKKEFVQLALKWCSANLGTIRHPYQLKIHYYRHKKYGGRYLFNGKQIVIYVYDQLSLICLTDTVIHEYTHHLQFDKQSCEGDYNKKHCEVGYWENPYEIEARQIAVRKRTECQDWVMATQKKKWCIQSVLSFNPYF